MENYCGMKKSELIERIIMILFGGTITAIGINFFIVPCNLLSGGVSGIGLVIQYLTGISVGYTTLLINIPLFILSMLKINKRFTVLTLVGTMGLSVALVFTKGFSNILTPVSPENELLYCIYGGVLNGLGVGIVFSNYGSTGGTDIIGMYVKRKYNVEIGSITFILNCIIVSIGAILFGLKTGLYTLIVMYISSFTIDKVINGFSRRKTLFIITDKKDEVSKAIMYNLNRGVTIIDAKGAYTKNDKNILYCVVSLRQVPRVKEYIKNIDSNAFISIIDTSEVQGNGFTSPLS